MALRPLILMLSIPLAACSGRYMGLDMDRLDPSTSAWAERARGGDKQAQYELGLRFARGDGVDKDCDKARKLFRQAATGSGGTIWVYSPPVTKGGAGRVIPINRGPVRPGLAAAQDALKLEGLCPKPN